MEGNSDKFVMECLEILLRPVLRFCLRRSIRFFDMIEMAKTAYIRLAEEQLQQDNQKVNVSRLSVITGIHRREVKRIYKNIPPRRKATNIISRVISHWNHDVRFCEQPGKPKKLNADGNDSEFYKLVRTVSVDTAPKSILIELERVGVLAREGDCVILDAENYVPKGDMKEGIRMMVEDAEFLMQSVEENIEDSNPVRNYHLLTEADGLLDSADEKIRKWLLKQGSLFHRRVTTYITQFDKDSNPKLDPKDCNTRVLIGGFSKVSNDKDEPENLAA